MEVGRFSMRGGGIWFGFKGVGPGVAGRDEPKREPDNAAERRGRNGGVNFPLGNFCGRRK